MKDIDVNVEVWIEHQAAHAVSHGRKHSLVASEGDDLYFSARPPPRCFVCRSLQPWGFGCLLRLLTPWGTSLPLLLGLIYRIRFSRDLVGHLVSPGGCSAAGTRSGCRSSFCRWSTGVEGVLGWLLGSVGSISLLLFFAFITLLLTGAQQISKRFQSGGHFRAVARNIRRRCVKFL